MHVFYKENATKCLNAFDDASPDFTLILKVVQSMHSLQRFFWHCNPGVAAHWSHLQSKNAVFAIQITYKLLSFT